MSISRRQYVRCVALWLAMASFALPTAALAQAPPPGQEPATPPAEHAPAADAAALRPPELQTFVEAEYPEALRDTGRQARVGLRLSIDAQGSVTDVEVSEPAADGFDEAARAAALQLVWKPALRGGVPIAARIHYVYEFHPASAPAPPAAASLPPTAAAQPAPAPQPVAAASEPAISVSVRGTSASERVRESSQAVTVVDTAEAKRHSGSVGELLARTEGVAVQRSGGLGSHERLSLHGLTDDQIRLFLDGVPLEFSGFGLGVSTVPLNWLERIEVYRGVVPLRYGADALGGAIDLITDQNERATSASVSYATGAFATHNLTLNARTWHQPTGLVARAAGFFDTTNNDYRARVRVTDELGRPEWTTLRRFHDGYRAGGGSVELGVVDKPWAQRLLLRLFATSFAKDLQHNFNMSVPYGAVTYAQNALGGTLRYALPHVAGSALGVTVLAGFNHRDLQFRDVSRWVYDWYGQRVFERPAGAGELSAFATDITQWEQRALARATLTYDLAPGHLLRLVVAPDLSIRTGRERLRVNTERRDPLTTRREILQVVSGFEYALRVLDDRIDNSAFAKHYLYQPSTDQVETFDNSLRRRDESRQRFGVGDALRVRFSRHALAKASYELATRLPRPDEVFGDGALILPQLDLKPEVSHNANLSVRVKQDLAHELGRVGAEVAGFWRQNSDMIVQLPAGDRVHTLFRNVADVTTLGVDGALDWSSAHRWFGLRVNGTWLDNRNRSSEGLFAMFRGQRLPNRPWLLGNATLHARIPRFVADNTALTFAWSTHYVHEFLPGWDETDAQNDIGSIPTQLVHNASLVYSLYGEWGVDFALDLMNLSDARVYDTLGVQKPGRAAYFKITVCWACQKASSAARND